LERLDSLLLHLDDALEVGDLFVFAADELEGETAVRGCDLGAVAIVAWAACLPALGAGEDVVDGGDVAAARPVDPARALIPLEHPEPKPLPAWVE
jgi:hypothetical protein